MSLVGKKIAILGATGYIGRSLLDSGRDQKFNIDGFSRDPKKAKADLSKYGIEVKSLFSYDQFLGNQYDVVINATGVGSPRKIAENPEQVKVATEEMDDVLLTYLRGHSDTRVFSISSGSVHRAPKNPDDKSQLSPGDQYTLAKADSEKRHRGWGQYSVIDLRVFAFVSRWLDTDEKFFIAEVAKCLLEGETLKTMSNDMVRDFATSDDLWEVVSFLVSKEPINNAFDIKTAAPVSKFELLEEVAQKLGLRYEVEQDMLDQSPTGQKNEYYSKSEVLENIGFKLQKTSLDNVLSELTVLKTTNS